MQSYRWLKNGTFQVGGIWGATKKSFKFPTVFVAIDRYRLKSGSGRIITRKCCQLQSSNALPSNSCHFLWIGEHSYYKSCRLGPIGSWRELLAFGWLAWHTAACSRHAMYSEVYSMYMRVMRQSVELDGALHHHSLRLYRSGKVFRKEKLTRKLVSVDEMDGKRRWRSNHRSK